MTQDDAAGLLEISEPSLRRIAAEGLVRYKVRSSVAGKPWDFNGADVTALKNLKKKLGAGPAMKAWRAKKGIPAKKDAR